MNTEFSLAAFKMVVLNFAEAMPIHIQAAKLDAHLKREKYLAFIHEGFTEEQALQLVK